MKSLIRSFSVVFGVVSLLAVVLFVGVYQYGDYIYRSEMQDRDWRGKLAKVLAEPEVWAAKPCMPAAVFGREYCFPQDRLVLQDYSHFPTGAESLTVVFISDRRKDDSGKPLTAEFYIKSWDLSYTRTIPNNAIFGRLGKWRTTPERKAEAERLFEALKPQSGQPDRLHDYNPYILFEADHDNDLIVLEREGERAMALLIDPPNGSYKLLGNAVYQREGAPYSIMLSLRTNQGTREHFIQSFVTWYDEFNDLLAETRTR